MDIFKINIQNILFLDIETVPEVSDFKNLNEEKQKLWDEKSKYKRADEETAQSFYSNAGIWSEFGKIICISTGFFKKDKDDNLNFRVKSFYGEEKSLLIAFKSLLNNHFNKREHLLCAHNGKEFDFPYISRRMIINKIKIPEKLNLFGKKPWEIPYLDTLELWRFGDYKSYTSLKLLTTILGIPSPKDDIDGSQICDVYYNDNDIKRIVRYCEKDTIAVAQVFLIYTHRTLLTDRDITIVN